MRSEELVTVYTVGEQIKAEIIKNALEAEGIYCFLEGENQAGGLAGVDIKIQVPQEDVARAREILAEHDRPARQSDEDEEPSTDITDLGPGRQRSDEPSTDVTDLNR